MFASQNGHSEVAELLLENRAKVNLTDKNGFSALMFASQKGHYRAVQLLVENGANVDLKNNDGNSALVLAGHFEVVELLLRLMDSKNNDGHSTISSSCPGILCIVSKM